MNKSKTSEAAKLLGQKAGAAVFKKYGVEHFKKMSHKRWKEHNAQVKQQKIADAKKLLGIK